MFTLQWARLSFPRPRGVLPDQTSHKTQEPFTSLVKPTSPLRLQKPRGEVCTAAPPRFVDAALPKYCTNELINTRTHTLQITFVEKVLGTVIENQSTQMKSVIRELI